MSCRKKCALEIAAIMMRAYSRASGPNVATIIVWHSKCQIRGEKACPCACIWWSHRCPIDEAEMNGVLCHRRDLCYFAQFNIVAIRYNINAKNHNFAEILLLMPRERARVCVCARTGPIASWSRQMAEDSNALKQREQLERKKQHGLRARSMAEANKKHTKPGINLWCAIKCSLRPTLLESEIWPKSWAPFFPSWLCDVCPLPINRIDLPSYRLHNATVLRS